MPLDGPDRDAKSIGDLGVIEPGFEHVEKLELAPRWPVGQWFVLIVPA